MNSEFVGEFVAFKGEEDACERQNVLLEVTDVTDDAVEIAFTSPLPGKPRCCVKFSLAELVRHAMSSD